MKIKNYDGRPLDGACVVTLKLDGVQLVVKDGLYKNKEGGDLYNLPSGLSDGLYEVYVGNWNNTINIVCSGNSPQKVNKDDIHAIYPRPEEKLILGMENDMDEKKVNEYFDYVNTCLDGEGVVIWNNGRCWSKQVVEDEPVIEEPPVDPRLKIFSQEVLDMFPPVVNIVSRAGRIVSNKDRYRPLYPNEYNSPTNSLENGYVSNGNFIYGVPSSAYMIWSDNYNDQLDKGVTEYVKEKFVQNVVQRESTFKHANSEKQFNAYLKDIFDLSNAYEGWAGAAGLKQFDHLLEEEAKKTISKK